MPRRLTPSRSGRKRQTTTSEIIDDREPGENRRRLVARLEPGLERQDRRGELLGLRLLVAGERLSQDRLRRLVAFLGGVHRGERRAELADDALDLVPGVGGRQIGPHLAGKHVVALVLRVGIGKALGREHPELDEKIADRRLIGARAGADHVAVSTRAAAVSRPFGTSVASSSPTYQVTTGFE